MEYIYFDIAKTDYDFLCAEKLIKTACVNHFNITRENGTAAIGDWSKDGVRFDDEQFARYFKLIVSKAKSYGRGLLTNPCIFVAKHDDGRVLCSLLAMCTGNNPDEVIFSFVSTLPFFRGKGIASRLTAFAAIEYIKRGIRIVISPDKENVAALRCRDRAVSIIEPLIQRMFRKSK